MALVILGQSECVLCRQTINDDSDFIGMPAFAFDSSDEHFLFNDAAVHRTCFERYPRRAALERRVAEAIENTRPSARRCVVCGEVVTDPDDHLRVPRLTNDEDPGARFNNLHFHKSHVSRWRELADLIALIERVRPSWHDNYLDVLLRDLRVGGGR